MKGVLHASGEGWVGSGVRSIETGIHELFTAAKRRVVISAYSISAGAFDLPLNWISEAATRNVLTIVVMNRSASQPMSVLAPIEQVARRTGLVQMWDYSGPRYHDLHAKAIIADDRRALIGSSNLSANGLLRNHELAVMVDGEAARLAADLIIKLTLSKYASRKF